MLFRHCRSANFFDLLGMPELEEGMSSWSSLDLDLDLVTK